jgi:uncharacterized protein (DUF924 family)
VFRGTPKAFSFDKISLNISKEIYSNPNVWKDYKFYEKMFILMPFMHSENKKDQETCLNAFTVIKSQAQLDGNLTIAKTFTNLIKFAEDHKKVIDQFGRYPTRNEVLGRENTKEEELFLKTAKGWGQ